MGWPLALLKVPFDNYSEKVFHRPGSGMRHEATLEGEIGHEAKREDETGNEVMPQPGMKP